PRDDLHDRTDDQRGAPGGEAHARQLDGGHARPLPLGAMGAHGAGDRNRLRNPDAVARRAGVSARLDKDAIFDPAAFERALAASNDGLPVFRAALRQGRAALHQCFLASPRRAAPLVGLHAWLVDSLLVRAWE